MMKTTLPIQNLKCGGCEATIFNKLSEITSVRNITIQQANNAVIFEHNSPNDIETVKNKLLKLGYPVVGEKNSLGNKAKSYVSCAIGRLHKAE